MTHIRTAIRDLIATRVTGLATAGDTVFKNRVKPIPASSLPGITVSLGDEDVQRATQRAPRRLRRVCQVHLDLIADSTDDPAPVLDTMAAECEAALVEGAWSAGHLFDIAPVALTEVFDGQGVKIAGQLRLSYEVEYHTAEGSPGSIQS